MTDLTQYRIVPVEPTAEMRDKGWRESSHCSSPAVVYKAMLAAAQTDHGLELVDSKELSELRKAVSKVNWLQSKIDCACNALTDSICISGNDAETNLSWIRKLRTCAKFDAKLAKLEVKP
jgi:hypothetical protein